jgi:hypothetical protein
MQSQCARWPTGPLLKIPTGAVVMVGTAAPVLAGDFPAQPQSNPLSGHCCFVKHNRCADGCTKPSCQKRKANWHFQQQTSMLPQLLPAVASASCDGHAVSSCCMAIISNPDPGLIIHHRYPRHGIQPQYM